jgi:hypothetical protein
VILIILVAALFTELMLSIGKRKLRKSSVSMILETVLFHNFFSPNLDSLMSKYYFRIKNESPNRIAAKRTIR